MPDLRTSLPAPAEAGGPLVQYGLAQLLSPVPGYAVLPIEEAFGGLDALLPELPRGEALAGVEGAAFYSRMREDITPQQVRENAEADESALQAVIRAVGAGGVLAYFRGHRLQNVDMGAGPYSDFGFTPSGLSACLVLRELVEVGAATREHQYAASRVKEWYGDRFKIIKFAVVIGQEPEGETVSFRRTQE